LQRRVDRSDSWRGLSGGSGDWKSRRGAESAGRDSARGEDAAERLDDSEFDGPESREDPDGIPTGFIGIQELPTDATGRAVVGMMARRRLYDRRCGRSPRRDCEPDAVLDRAISDANVLVGVRKLRDVDEKPHALDGKDGQGQRQPGEKNDPVGKRLSHEPIISVKKQGSNLRVAQTSVSRIIHPIRSDREGLISNMQV